ncbi:MAG: type II toxin-antitoxin system VapC family toxin [Gemmatimonadaceae bacterium]
MKLLFDSGALLHWRAGSLKPAGTKAVRRAEEVYVSAVTAAEISIKSALGKLRFVRSVEDAISQYGFVELPVSVRHGDRVGYLPRHHGDPFDRILIAQAIEEGLTILTSDRVFELYQVSVEWV